MLAFITDNFVAIWRIVSCQHQRTRFTLCNLNVNVGRRALISLKLQVSTTIYRTRWIKYKYDVFRINMASSAIETATPQATDSIRNRYKPTHIKDKRRHHKHQQKENCCCQMRISSPVYEFIDDAVILPHFIIGKHNWPQQIHNAIYENTFPLLYP